MPMIYCRAKPDWSSLAWQRHFGKAYLFDQVKQYSWNSLHKESDLTNVIKYTRKLLLLIHYDDLSHLDFTMPDGPNEQVSEVILASQFSDDTNSHRCGKFIFITHQFIKILIKRDISGDRIFQNENNQLCFRCV